MTALMITHRRLAAPILAGLVLQACGEADPPPVDVFAGLPVWSYEAEPSLVLGDSAGDGMLVYPAGALELSDGRIIVTDAGDYSVKCFDADGVLLWRSGRWGGGPGEYKSIDWDGLASAGDTLVVWDRELRRATWLSSRGEYIGSADLRSRGTVRPPILSATGRSIVVQVNSYIFPRTRFGLVRDSAEIMSIDRVAGTSLLMKLPGQQYAIVAGPSGQPGAFTDSGFKNGLRGAGSGGTFYLAVTDSSVVHRYVSDGSRVGEVRWNVAPIPTDDSFKRVMLKSVVEAANAATRKRNIEASFRSGHLPPYLPAFDRVLVDDEGNVWVHPVVYPARPPFRWMVFDSLGQPRAIAELPSGTRNIRNGAALTRWEDEDDVMYVRRHRLVR